MTSPIVRYELDPTGTSLDNYVLNEPVSLTSNALRVFVPQQGAYFDDSMTLVDVASGKTLTRNQYYPSQPAIIPSVKYGKGIYYCVVVTDSAVSPNISSSYQALGGEWAYSNSALASQIEQLLTDDKTVPWSNVSGKPFVFNPAPHLQSSGDLYGMEYVVESLYAIRNAINLDNYSLIASIVDRLRTLESGSTLATEELRSSLTAAINDLVTIVDAKIGGSNDSLATLALAIQTEVAARVLGIDAANNSISDIVAKNYIPGADKTSLENASADAFYNSSSKVLTPMGGLNLMQKHLLSPSTDNQLSFVNGGLYLGTVAPVDVASIYVDAVNGDDSNPGTSARPMRTIKAVVDKGPPNVDRTIHLREGQEHIVSPAAPVRMRGGKWGIVPYGPLSNLLPPVPGKNIWSQIAARDMNTRIKSEAYVSVITSGVSSQCAHALYPDYGAAVTVYATTFICGAPNTSTDAVNSLDGSFHYVSGGGQWRLLNCEVQLPNARSRFISTSKSVDISLSLYACTISGPGKLAAANNKYFTLVFDGGSLTDTDLTADKLIAYLLNWQVNALQFSNFNTNLVPSATLAPYVTDADVATAIAAIPNNSVGVGQTWTDENHARVLNVVYTNATSKPMAISLYLWWMKYNDSFYIQCRSISSIDWNWCAGVEVPATTNAPVNTSSSASGIIATVSTSSSAFSIIPPGWQYRVISVLGTAPGEYAMNWFELK